MRIKIIAESGIYDIVQGKRSGPVDIVAGSIRELRALCGPEAAIGESGGKYVARLEKDVVAGLITRLVER